MPGVFMIVRALAVAATASLCAHSTIAFSLESTSGLSDSLDYSKTWLVRSAGKYPVRLLSVTLPGRVFIKYVASSNSDSKGNTVFGRIRVTALTKTALDAVLIKSEASSFIDDETLSLSVSAGSMAAYAALVVEIELTSKHVLKEVSKHGPCDVVVEANVLYSTDADPFLDVASYKTPNRTALIASGTKRGHGGIYVVDKTALLSAQGVYLYAYDGEVVQVELNALKATAPMKVVVEGSGVVFMFTKSLTGDIGVVVAKGEVGGTVCIDADNKVAMTAPDDRNVSVSYPGKTTDAFACVAKAVPTRVVSSSRSSSQSFTTSDGSAATPTGTKSAASAGDKSNGVLRAAAGLVLATVFAVQAAA